MAKLKPKWVKTDIPKDTKMKLWRIMKDNPTFDTFQGQVSKHYDEIFSKLSKAEDKYGTISRDTYRALQYEIKHMPPEEVSNLPQDLQTWVKQLRPELQLGRCPKREAEGYSIGDVDAIVSMPGLEKRHKTILLMWLGLDEAETAEKLDIPLGHVWRYIEETGKELESIAILRKPEEVGKVKTKEIKEFFDVCSLMSQFLGGLTTEDPCRILPAGTERMEFYHETSWVEDNPLFPKLKKLFDNNFWRKFADWKKARSQYREKYNSFLDAVRQRAEKESQMEITDSWEGKGLNDVFPEEICRHVLTKTNPKLDEYDAKRLDATQLKSQADGPVTYLMIEGTNLPLAKGEAASELECVSRAYWRLVTEFALAGEEIWKLWQEVRTIEKSLDTQAGAVYHEIAPKWFRDRDTIVEI